jgi:hypothetical protein
MVAGEVGYPPLVFYATEQEYRQHFYERYCTAPITTFDGILVRFKKHQFDHCFFESTFHKDDTFSRMRAERIDWIGATLQDVNAELYVGWDNKRKRPASGRRVAVVHGDYVVVIQLLRDGRAALVTAFVDKNGRAVAKIRTNPKWTKKYR